MYSLINLIYMIDTILSMGVGLVIGVMFDDEYVKYSPAGKIVGLIGGALFGVLITNLFMSI